MSFKNTLNRLREAVKGQRGRNGDVSVSAYDLRDLLQDFDRLDAKVRSGLAVHSPTSGTVCTCPKCKGADVRVDHFGGGELVNSSSHCEVDNEFLYSSEYEIYWQVKARKEHLRKLCNGCGYTWLEGCGSEVVPTADEGETPAEVLAGRLMDILAAEKGGQITWAEAVTITASITKMPDSERVRLLGMQ